MKLKAAYVWWAAIIIVPIIYYSRIAAGISDFNVFLHAAEALSNGVNPYYEWFEMGDGHREYFYSPFFAMLLIPFTHLPYEVVNILWLIASILMLRRSAVLLSNWVKLETFTQREKRLAVIFIVVIGARFVIHNFEMVQMTIFLLWASVETIHLSIDRGRELAGGMLLGFALMIKTLPITLVPYLFWRGRWKAGLATIGMAGILALSPTLFLGWNTNVNLHTSWVEVLDPDHRTRFDEDAGIGPQDLTAMIPALLTETKGEIDEDRNLMTLDRNTADLITNISRGLLIVLTLFVLRTIPGVRSKGDFHRLWEFSYILLITPLIFPIQHKYAFLLMLPALFYLSRFGLFRQPSTRWYTLVLLSISVVLLVFSTPGLIGSEYGRLAEHFKLITWGTLTLMLALLVNPPPEITSTERKMKT